MSDQSEKCWTHLGKLLQLAKPCPNCDATGVVVSHLPLTPPLKGPCPVCDGKKRIPVRRWTEIQRLAQLAVIP